jgi:chondroitin AC lyase
MASAWACTTCDTTHQQAPLLKSAESGLRYWLGSDPKNPNWYQNDIAVPREIGKIGVLLRAVLSSTDVEKMVMLLKRSTPEKWTGANAMDGYRIQVYRGVLADDRSLVEDALKQTYAAVKYFPQKDDSFQLDHSFHQHGPQLLPAVYGAVIASNTMALAAWAEGTSIAMNAASFAVFEGYVLDGLVWYAAGTATSAVWDWQVAGRRITVPYLESEWKWRPAFSLKGCPSGGQGCMVAPSLSIGLEPAGMRLLGGRSKRRDEWEAFAALIDGSGPAARTALGNRAYWDSDYVAHSRPGYLFSVHMVSNR